MGTHCSSLELLVEFLCEGEERIVEDEFQNRDNSVLGYDASIF